MGALRGEGGRREKRGKQCALYQKQTLPPTVAVSQKKERNKAAHRKFGQICKFLFRTCFDLEFSLGAVQVVDNTNSKKRVFRISIPASLCSQGEGRGGKAFRHFFPPITFLLFLFSVSQATVDSLRRLRLRRQAVWRVRPGNDWVRVVGAYFFCNRRKKRGLFFSSSLALRAVIAAVAENVVMTAVRVQELVGSLGFFFAHFLPPGYRGGERRENDKKIIAKNGRGNASCSVPNWRNSLTRRGGPKKMKYRVFLLAEKTWS